MCGAGDLMSVLVEPGARIAGRYRLKERLSQLAGSALWKAVDEPLARTVAVRTFTDGFPRVSQVIAAARAASRVPDSRLAQVFDADENTECPYLVCEWIEGSRLLDMVARVPLDPHRAADFVGEAADAIASAHAAGLAHLRLDPSSLIWARGGTVKVTGLAIDAALHNLPVGAGAPVTDARALGALLYAALTAYWPGSRDADLPAPPRGEGGAAPANDINPDVPAPLAAVAARALGQPGWYAQTPLDSPAAVRDALATVQRPVPPTPESPQAHRTPEPPQAPRWSDADIPAQSGGLDRPAGDRDGGSHGRRRSRALLAGAAGLAVVAAAALGAWEFGRVMDESGAGNRPGNPAVTSEPSEPTGGSDPPEQKLPVANVDDYDPYGSGGAHPEEVRLAVDGEAGTFWNTQTYTGPQLGNLKPGLGLMLDMGDPASVAYVQVRLRGGETSLALYAGGQPDIDAMKKVATATDASGRVALRPPQPVEARYLLIWITELPPVSDGYQAKVAEITVRGRVASA